MDNIAEGFGRMGNLEFIRFLTIATGSTMETRSQLCRALDRAYITKNKFDELVSLNAEISNMLNALINYLSNSNLKGIKYKKREGN
jgi:four helix bundle protein